MALAVSAINDVIKISGNQVLRTATVTLDTAYPTGGSTGLLAMLKLATIEVLLFAGAGGYDFDYLVGTDKLKVWGSGAAAGASHAEVANLTNLSAIQVPVLVVGTV